MHIVIVTILLLTFLCAGVYLIALGESYRRQGKTFPARRGDNTPPSTIIFCGVLLVGLAIVLTVLGIQGD